MVVVLAITVLDVGISDAHSRRRHRRQAQKNRDKQTRVEERQVSNLGVTVQFTDNEPILPLGGGFILDDDPDFFDGSVTGFRNQCQGRILVEVFRANGESLGSTEASDSGSWNLQYEDPVQSGDSSQFFARATRFGTGRGARFACGKGISDTITATDEDASLF
jgi:hypothetical protein